MSTTLQVFELYHKIMQSYFWQDSTDKIIKRLKLRGILLLLLNVKLQSGSKVENKEMKTGISKGNCSTEIDSRVYNDFLGHFRETFFNLIFDREAEGI